MRTLVLCLILASAAWADIVVLKDGTRIEGKVEDLGDRIRITVRGNAVTYPKSMIREIIKKKTIDEVFEEKAKALDANDIKGHLKLAAWCEENGLKKEATAEYEQVIRIDVNHALARRRLGYWKHDGVWRSDEALRAKFGEKGLRDAVREKNTEAAIKVARDVAAFDHPMAAEVLIRSARSLISRRMKYERDLKDKWKTWKEYEEYWRNILRLWTLENGLVGSYRVMKNPEVVTYLAERLTESASPTERVLLAEALSHMQAVDVLAKRLPHEPEEGVLVSILDSIARSKPKEDWIRKSVEEKIRSRKWQVRISAARALAELKSADSIAPLIRSLKKAEGRSQDELNKALVDITGVDYHGSYEAWNDWWGRNEEAFRKGAYKPNPAEKPDAPGRTTFYGLPVTSRRVVFVLDVSGSMKEDAKWVPTGARLEGKRKIDVARYELQKVLKQLPEDAHFNIVAYNHRAFSVSPDMVKLTEENLEKAVKAINRVEPAGSTNIGEALEKAFSFAGVGARDRFRASAVDTIYLLSDGKPTFGIRDTELILEAVSAMNRLRKVAIHTVAIESDEESLEFLKSLSARNSGAHIRR